MRGETEKVARGARKGVLRESAPASKGCSARGAVHPEKTTRRVRRDGFLSSRAAALVTAAVGCGGPGNVQKSVQDVEGAGLERAQASVLEQMERAFCTFCWSQVNTSSRQ